MILTANVFSKLETVKILVRRLSKKRRFRTLFDKEHVKASLKSCEISMKALISRFLSFSVKLIWKISPLGLGEILGVFVNTLTGDCKYPVEGYENLQLLIQMQLSEKRKTFHEFFVLVLESTSNFEHFEKNMIVTANVFSKLETVKILVGPLSKKRSFRTRFDKAYVKASLKTCEMSMRAL